MRNREAAIPLEPYSALCGGVRLSFILNGRMDPTIELIKIIPTFELFIGQLIMQSRRSRLVRMSNVNYQLFLDLDLYFCLKRNVMTTIQYVILSFFYDM